MTYFDLYTYLEAQGLDHLYLMDDEPDTVVGAYRPVDMPQDAMRERCTVRDAVESRASSP
jgi:hypothetical protein